MVIVISSLFLFKLNITGRVLWSRKYDKLPYYYYIILSSLLWVFCVVISESDTVCVMYSVVQFVHFCHYKVFMFVIQLTPSQKDLFTSGFPHSGISVVSDSWSVSLTCLGFIHFVLLSFICT